MNINVIGASDSSIGKIKAVVGMRTREGLVQKVNAKTVYVGGNSEEPTWNEQYSSSEISVPVWYLTAEQLTQIEFKEGLSLETISATDKGLIAICQQDEREAVDFIRAITEFHTTKLKAEDKANKENKSERQTLFGQFGSVHDFATLMAVQKLVD